MDSKLSLYLVLGMSELIKDKNPALSEEMYAYANRLLTMEDLFKFIPDFIEEKEKENAG